MNMGRRGCLVSIDMRQEYLVSTGKRKRCFNEHAQGARMFGER